MRLDARHGDVGWNVIDIPTGRELGHICLWVDDETAQWGECILGFLHSGLPEIVHQERRIAIYPDRRLVLLNPVEDDDAESIDAVDAIATGVAVVKFERWLAAEIQAHRARIARDAVAWRKQLRRLNRRSSAEYTAGQRALHAKWAAE